VSGQFDVSSAQRSIDPGRPLIIVDADEVVLSFVDGFDRFLRTQDLFLDLTSYRLHGNVKRLTDRTPLLDVEVTALLEEFRADLDSLEAIPGVCESLTMLSEIATIVVLSNVTPAQARARSRNLLSLGLDLPLIANSGAKGLAVKALAARVQAPGFFIDDIPQHLASAAEHAPEVFRIHFVADAKLRGLLPLTFHANYEAGDWAATATFITAHL